MNELKLFAVYLGGRADRCNIELHDVVFVVGSCIEETYRVSKLWNFTKNVVSSLNLLDQDMLITLPFTI